MTRALWAIWAAFTALLVATPALAEPSARDRAAAEAIFRQAMVLMDEARYAEACEKLAASQQLDPGLGTLLYLADCYDRAGRSASAWALFREVEQRAGREAQADRERIARERADALEGKLSKLELRISPKRQAAGLEVRLGGSLIPPASWNTPLPVDPGPARLEASQPGKLPLSMQVTLEPGPSQRVLPLPPLDDAPRGGQEAGIKPQPARGAAREGSVQKSIGYVMAATGLVALGVGGFFAYRAYEHNSDSKAHCRVDDPNACTREGFDLRQSAQSSARMATLVSISGATLTLGGLTLAVTAPAHKREVAGWQAAWRGEW